ncbi:MAG: TolC family protein [Betaproteobacteria bacterium]|nr:TolC family protein [Betaproteobacteria bacterium]
MPTGLPSDLAERRPDLKAAESRFRAAFYNVEVAKKAKLPSISLMAGLGVVDNNLLVLQKDLQNPVWGVTGRVLAPLFTGGALEAQVEVKTAQQQEATVQYAKTMLNALNEIEGGLYADQMLADRYSLLNAQLADQQTIVELQRVQVKVGKGNMYQLQQQQISLASSKMSFAATAERAPDSTSQSAPGFGWHLQDLSFQPSKNGACLKRPITVSTRQTHL